MGNEGNLTVNQAAYHDVQYSGYNNDKTRAKKESPLKTTVKLGAANLNNRWGALADLKLETSKSFKNDNFGVKASGEGDVIFTFCNKPAVNANGYLGIDLNKKGYSRFGIGAEVDYTKDYKKAPYAIQQALKAGGKLSNDFNLCPKCDCVTAGWSFSGGYERYSDYGSQYLNKNGAYIGADVHITQKINDKHSITYGAEGGYSFGSKKYNSNVGIGWTF